MSRRVLTVVGQSAYNYKEAPTIRLHGRWLEGLGFNVGEKVTVEEEYGRLTISRIDGNTQPVGKPGMNGGIQTCRED